MLKCLTLFLLAISSCYCKVVTTEHDLEVNNTLGDNTKEKIHIDLPTIKPPKTSENAKHVGSKKHARKPSLPNNCDTANNLDGEINNVSGECKEQNINPALILTPYIENGRIEEARQASAVNRQQFLGYESYSGFFTVNTTYNSNMFFWYFPVENKIVNESPWIIWLQGGPGASSMTGLFDEVGPFKVNKLGGLQPNPYTWVKNHSLVFIENPVGTGYSFTNHDDGYARDMATYSAHLYSTVKQLLQVFPELKTAPLYIAGESYAGKYVPSLGIELHRHKKIQDIEVNLQGLILGNAFIEPAMVRNVALPFYYFGLLTKEQLKRMDPLIQRFHESIDANDSVEAKKNWVILISTLILMSYQKHGHNFMKDNMVMGGYKKFLDSSEVRNAIHVGTIEYDFLNVTVNEKIAPDFLSSSKGYVEELLNSYRVLSYCGQLDQLLACIFCAENHRSWQWKNRKEFIDSHRIPYKYRNKIAAYVKSGGGLTEAVIRGAGHMVPTDEPARIQKFVADWTHNIPIIEPATLIEEELLQKYINGSSLLYL